MIREVEKKIKEVIEDKYSLSREELELLLGVSEDEDITEYDLILLIQEDLYTHNIFLSEEDVLHYLRFV